jgi:hypothetical protein
MTHRIIISKQGRHNFWAVAQKRCFKKKGGQTVEGSGSFLGRGYDDDKIGQAMDENGSRAESEETRRNMAFLAWDAAEDLSRAHIATTLDGKLETKCRGKKKASKSLCEVSSAVDLATTCHFIHLCFASFEGQFRGIFGICPVPPEMKR